MIVWIVKTHTKTVCVNIFAEWLAVSPPSTGNKAGHCKPKKGRGDRLKRQPVSAIVDQVYERPRFSAAHCADVLSHVTFRVFYCVPHPYIWGFPGSSEVKASACNAGELGSIPGLGRSPGEGNDTPLQYSCLGNPINRGAWQATVCRFAKSQTQLSNWAQAHTCFVRKIIFLWLYIALVFQDHF